MISLRTAFALLGLLLVGLVMLLASGVLFVIAFLLFLIALASPLEFIASVTMTTLLVAGLSFLIGAVFSLLGLLAFRRPEIITLLRIGLLIFRLLKRLLPSPHALVDFIRSFANALDAFGDFLKNTIGPGLKATGERVKKIADNTDPNYLPTIPAVNLRTDSLWLETDSRGNRRHGYVKNVFGFPEVKVITHFSLDGDLLSVLKTDLNQKGDAIKQAGSEAETHGQLLMDIAGSINTINDEIEPLLP